MLEVNGDKDEIPSTVTGRIREVLARNIAARNHGISPLQFTGAVTTLLSSLVAARLLEEAGVFPLWLGRRADPDYKVLPEDLSSLFEDSNAGEDGGIPPGLNWDGCPALAGPFSLHDSLC